jgi:hypothetical protein
MLTTDGAGAMVGCKTGLMARVMQVAPNVKWTHCSIHREALAVKKMSTELKTVLDELVKIVNYIKSRPLNSRIFTKLCQEMGSEHEQLFLHTEVRWLSRGNVLTRFFKLADEVRILLCDGKHKNFILREKLNDFSWLCKITYLTDLFTHLNVLNMKLQETDTNIFVVEDKIEAMIEKLKLWVNRIERKSYASLPV